MMMRAAVAAAVVGLALANPPVPQPKTPAPVAPPVPPVPMVPKMAPKAPILPKCQTTWGGDLTGLSPHRFVDSDSYFLISAVQSLEGGGVSDYVWQFSGCSEKPAPRFLGQPGCPSAPNAYGYQFTKKGEDMYDCEVGWNVFLGQKEVANTQAVTYAYEGKDTKRGVRKTLNVTVTCDTDITEVAKYLADNKVARLDPDVINVAPIKNVQGSYAYRALGVKSVCACAPAKAPGGKLPPMCSQKDTTTPKQSPIPTSAYQYAKKDCSGSKLIGNMYGVFPYNGKMPQVYWSEQITAKPTTQNYFWSMAFCQPTTPNQVKYSGCGLIDGDGLLEQYNEAGICEADFEWAPRAIDKSYKIAKQAYTLIDPAKSISPDDYGCGTIKKVGDETVTCPVMKYTTPGISYQILDPTIGGTPRYAFVRIRCNAAPGAKQSDPVIPDTKGPTITVGGKGGQPFVPVIKTKRGVNGGKVGTEHFEYNFFMQHYCACPGKCQNPTNPYDPKTANPVQPSITQQCDKVVVPKTTQHLWVIQPDIAASKKAVANNQKSYFPVFQKAVDADSQLTATFSIYFYPCLGNLEVPECPGAFGSLLTLKSDKSTECDSFVEKPTIKVQPKTKTTPTTVEFVFASRATQQDPTNPKAPVTHTHFAHIYVACAESEGAAWVADDTKTGTKKEHKVPAVERWHFYFKSSCACPNSPTCTQPNWTPGALPPNIVSPSRRPHAPSFNNPVPTPPHFNPFSPLPIPHAPVAPVAPVPAAAPKAVPVAPVAPIPMAPVPVAPVSPTAPKAKADSGGMGSGAVAGIIIGCLVVVAALAGVGFFLWKKQQAKGFEEIQ